MQQKSRSTSASVRPGSMSREWIEAPLSTLLEHTIGGVWGEAPGGAEIDVGVVRSTNFRSDGRLETRNAAERSVKTSQLTSRQLQRGDILLEKSGGGPKQPVGRVVYVADDFPGVVCGNFIQLLRPNRDVDPRWLFYLLWGAHSEGTTLLFQTQTTGIRNLRTKEYLERPVRVPPLGEQRRIADLLGEADALLDRIRGRREAVARLLAARREALLVSNGSWEKLPDGWRVSPVGEVLELKLGFTKGRKLTGDTVEMPYLRAANVHNGQLRLDDVRVERVRVAEYGRWMLRPDDILMIEGGNPDDVGRGWIWEGQISPCIHQNSVFRGRIRASDVRPRYVAYAITSTPCRRYCAGASIQTSNIAHIGSDRMSAMPIAIPPLPEQESFTRELDAVRAAWEAAEDEVAKQEALRLSLIHILLSGTHQMPPSYDRFLANEDQAGGPLEPATS